MRIKSLSKDTKVTFLLAYVILFVLCFIGVHYFLSELVALLNLKINGVHSILFLWVTPFLVSLFLPIELIKNSIKFKAELKRLKKLIVERE